MHLAKVVLPLVFLLAASAGADALVTGYIGCRKLSFKAREVAGKALFTVKGPADYLAITEVYPDAPGGVEYAYTVLAKGIDNCDRFHKSIGFGPVTFFIRVKSSPIGTINISNTGKTPARISRVWTVKQSELDDLLAKDSFRILGLTSTGDDGEKLVKQLAEGIPGRPDYHISTGFSAEIRYANQSADAVRREIENCAKWSKTYGIPAMLGLVSWWSGTPLGEPDGEGGKFGDIKYQQICYTPTVEQPEDPNLKALLGDRYNRHYCLSVPNEWSSTPWLTMNSTALNDYRAKRMEEATAMIREASGDFKWLDNVYLENEPRYWDTACEAGNNKRKPCEMWADFNPCVIADAKNDGVDLDPGDGLSNEELAWLFRNVAKYNQWTADTANAVLRKHGFPRDLPVYTHSLQHRDMFPGGAIGHPASEWAYASGARTGIEGMWSQPSDFIGVREWGRWANINREENDGRHTDEHLWDLRVDYMMGGDLYNSYNWNAIGEGRFIGYVKEFLSQFPIVALAPEEVKLVDPESFAFRTPMKLQAFSSVTLLVQVTQPVKGSATLTLTDKDGRLIRMSTTAVDLKTGKSSLKFDFADPAESPCRDTATATLRVTDSAGKVSSVVSPLIDPASGLTLSLDLRTQRALSLTVIHRPRNPGA